MKKGGALALLFIAIITIANGQTTFGNWTLSHTGQWPTGPGLGYSGGDETFGISSGYGQISLQIDGGFRQHETGKTNYFMDKVGIGLMNPSVHLDVNGKGRFTNNLKVFGTVKPGLKVYPLLKLLDGRGFDYVEMIRQRLATMEIGRLVTIIIQVMIFRSLLRIMELGMMVSFISAIQLNT